MSLIDTTYFKNALSIPIGTYSDLQNYIDEFEETVLIGLLGYDLYTEMMAAFAALPGVPLPDKWDKLINGTSYTYGSQSLHWNGLINTAKKSFIANYVYCQYLQAKQSATSATGTVQAKNENSIVVDGIAKHSNAWNEFVTLYAECYQFLGTDTTSYPLVNPWQYKRTNIFGI